MTPKKNIIEDYLNYDLSEEALDKLSSDAETLQKIDVAKISDKLSKEFFRPGYERFMAEKKEQFRGLIEEEKEVESHPIAELKSNAKRNFLILLIGAFLIGTLFLLTQVFKQDHNVTIEEVRQYALLSYESTGAIDANRGLANTQNQLSENYELLVNGNCDDLTLNGKYLEQELWSQLYCAYLHNDKAKFDKYKSEIINKKYANHSKL